MGVNYVDNGCCLSYKDTILKANHSKLLKLLLLMQLLLILQRYYFESESQLRYAFPERPERCCLSYKDTILKANHSLDIIPRPVVKLLLILQRYYFESESQPETELAGFIQGCCLSYKDTILKANHSIRLLAIRMYRAVAYPTKILF